MSPLSALLADRLPRRKPVVLLTSGATAPLVYPVFLIITHVHGALPVLCSVGLISALLALGSRFDGIVASTRTRQTNGFIEAVNGLFQAAKRIGAAMRPLLPDQSAAAMLRTAHGDRGHAMGRSHRAQLPLRRPSGKRMPVSMTVNPGT